MSDELTIEDVIKTFGLATTQEPFAVGLAFSAHTYACLRRSQRPLEYFSFSNTICGVPFIIDGRIKVGEVECYKDKKLWKERVKEQNNYDLKGGRK